MQNVMVVGGGGMLERKEKNLLEYKGSGEK